MREEITSLELHLDCKSESVVRCRKLRDVGAGMYPCYYTEKDDEILVSTSVTSLIQNLGSFEKNSDFDPPEYLKEKRLLDRTKSKLPDTIQSKIGFLGPYLRDLGLLSSSRWYENQETVDTRIDRLQPFETITPHSINQDFNTTYSLNDPDEFVELSAQYIESFVNDIEEMYPDHQHVIRMGGKDSQLISLVSKETENWHVFSAEPNYPIVRDFLGANNIEVNNIFRHDNVNKESEEEFSRKVIASDLRADPRHLRWYPKLEEIVDRFDGKCIFWCGTEGDTINSYYHVFHEVDDYFGLQFSRAANWQAITHQVTKNYTGAVALSPYHSEKIWENVYRHYNPEMMSPGMDLREDIGRLLLGSSAKWPERNPGPDPYEYSDMKGCHDIYMDYIEMLVE